MSHTLFDLHGNIAVVIGGTTGLGHAIALGLAGAGADVVASSRRLGAGGTRWLRRSRRWAGARCALPSDVLDRASLQALHDAVLKEFGKVDILVNAAGITHRAPTLEADEADWSRVIETNLTGTLRACQIFGATMVRAGYGRIINIASLSFVCGFLPGGGVLRQQGRGRLAHQVAGH